MMSENKVDIKGTNQQKNVSDSINDERTPVPKDIAEGSFSLQKLPASSHSPSKGDEIDGFIADIMGSIDCLLQDGSDRFDKEIDNTSYKVNTLFCDTHNHKEERDKQENQDISENPTLYPSKTFYKSSMKKCKNPLTVSCSQSLYSESATGSDCVGNVTEKKFSTVVRSDKESVSIAQDEPIKKEIQGVNETDGNTSKNVETDLIYDRVGLTADNLLNESKDTKEVLVDNTNNNDFNGANTHDNSSLNSDNAVDIEGTTNNSNKIGNNLMLSKTDGPCTHQSKTLDARRKSDSASDTNKWSRFTIPSEAKFLSLDRAIRNKMHHLHNKPEFKSVSNDSLTVKPLQRKYSAPACFCKVQKVISIDIPKMETYVMREQYNRNSHRHPSDSALEIFGSLKMKNSKMKGNCEVSDKDAFVKKNQDKVTASVPDLSDAKYDEIDWNGNMKINEDAHLNKTGSIAFGYMSSSSITENKVLDKDFQKASVYDLYYPHKNGSDCNMNMEVTKDGVLNKPVPNTDSEMSNTSVTVKKSPDKDLNPNSEIVHQSKVVPNIDVDIPDLSVAENSFRGVHFKNASVSDPNKTQNNSSYCSGNMEVSEDAYMNKNVLNTNFAMSSSSVTENMSIDEDFTEASVVNLNNSSDNDYNKNMEVNEDAYLNSKVSNINVDMSDTLAAENTCKLLDNDFKNTTVSDLNSSDYNDNNRIGNMEVKEDASPNEVVPETDVGMSVVEVRLPDRDFEKPTISNDKLSTSCKGQNKEHLETAATEEVKHGSSSKVNMQETIVWDPGVPMIPPRVKINKPMGLKKHITAPETPPPPSPHTTEQLITSILKCKVTKRDRQTTMLVSDRRQKDIDKRMAKNIYLKPDFEMTRKQVDVKGIVKNNMRNKSAQQKKMLNKYVGNQTGANSLKDKRKSRDMMEFLESYKLVENFRYQNKQTTEGDNTLNYKSGNEQLKYPSFDKQNESVQMRILEEKPEELKPNSAVTQSGYSMKTTKHTKNKSIDYTDMPASSNYNLLVKLNGEKFFEKLQSSSEKMKPSYEDSSDFQVMVNSLSPVLMRRNASRMERRNSTSVTGSPDRKAKVYESNQGKNISMETLAVPELHSEPLLMDPQQARTWHGTTNLNWSMHYGPDVRIDGEVGSSNSSLNVDKSDSEIDPKPLTGKSLLDEMHKKFCSDQYGPSQNSILTRDITLLRLKSARINERLRRSQSFNIRMGTGNSSFSITRDRFASLQKTRKRIGIKTRPDFQYSPRLSRAVIEGQPAKIPEIKVPVQKTESGSDMVQRQGVGHLTCAHTIQTFNDSEKEAIWKHCEKTEKNAQIEAIEACRWLRETGFPQYAQLYEDGQFPLDIESVEKDHDFLDKEDIQSLFKRLNTLNKCAVMKIGTPAKKEAEDSDEEEQCALSDKWKYQRSCRRWSRKDLEPPDIENRHNLHILRSTSSHDSLLADQNSSSETGDSPVLDNKMHHIDNGTLILSNSTPFDTNANATRHFGSKVIQRTASEKIKGAKGFLKRMESLKSRKSRKHKTITEISDPVPANRVDMQAKIKHLNCKEIKSAPDKNSHSMLVSSSSASKLPDTSDDFVLHGLETDVNARHVSGNGLVREPFYVNKDDNSSGSSTSATPSVSDTTLDLSISTNGFSGHDLSPVSKHSNSSETTNSSEDTVFLTSDHRPGKFPTILDDSLFRKDRSVCARSLSYCAESDQLPVSRHSGRGSNDPKKRHNRVSIYDNVPIEEDLQTAQKELDIILSELFQNINGMNKAIYGESAELLELPTFSRFDDNISVDSSALSNEPAGNLSSDFTSEHEGNKMITGALSSPDTSDHEQTEGLSNDESLEPIEKGERRDSGVGSSLTRTNSDRRKYRIRWHSFQKTHRPSLENHNLQLNCVSAGQIMVLRKLSLLKLTALIETYSPNRSGWSLSVPRFMKRHKMPDYKDKHVFGIPFTVMIQRTGQALPQCILHAMRFLRRTSGDAVGLFRKSGVRSRIQKLRSDIEANPEIIDYEEQQAYDLADLVKQFFRELPECLLTNKLSDIFISIFTYVPEDLRLEALQAAIILMADENRDVLLSLLLFLGDIAKHHNKHQMTASNLAVCFAPSLFNMCGTRHPNLTPSPRRTRKNIGVPDARELMEQKAAHECLTVMIQECKRIFTIPAATLVKCRIRHSDPVTLDQLSGDDISDGNHGYTSYVDACIQGLLKESREKFRGWVSVSVHNDVDVSFKKVGDGHPLRLWKCTVDVEAPPNEVLNRVLHERQIWDEDLLQWHTVQKLDEETDVFQYVRNSMAPHPTREYLVLRSWRTNLPKGACVLVSTSIEHSDTELQGGIRAVELASRYLIEPCGAGKSRLTHISRIDIRGHHPEWYKKVYGHISANFIAKICSSFKTKTNGPETKV